MRSDAVLKAGSLPHPMNLTDRGADVAAMRRIPSSRFARAIRSKRRRRQG
jgi:hypothetical protein